MCHKRREGSEIFGQRCLPRPSGQSRRVRHRPVDNLRGPVRSGPVPLHRSDANSLSRVKNAHSHSMTFPGPRFGQNKLLTFLAPRISVSVSTSTAWLRIIWRFPFTSFLLTQSDEQFWRAQTEITGSNRRRICPQTQPGGSDSFLIFSELSGDRWLTKSLTWHRRSFSINEWDYSESGLAHASAMISACPSWFAPWLIPPTSGDVMAKCSSLIMGNFCKIWSDSVAVSGRKSRKSRKSTNK